MKELLKELCLCSGVSGYEDEIRVCIEKKIEAYADEMYTDPLGNLMVFKKGAARRKEKMLVCAHMDEVGFLIRDITADGMLRLASVGGIDPRILIGRKMEVGAKRVKGVISLKAIHLTTAEERKVAASLDSLYIDIGVSSKKEAEQLTFVGDYATFDSPFREFGDQRIKCKAIDDRIGCAVMIKMIEEGVPYDTWFAFTVGEEIGLRGALTAAGAVKPDISLVIEGTTAGDIPGVPEHRRVVSQGKGAAVYLADKATIYKRELVRSITEKATQAGIRWQYRVSMTGGNDSGSIHLTGDGALAFAIAAPCRYIHSACNVLYYPDAEEVLRLAKLFVKEAKLDA